MVAGNITATAGVCDLYVPTSCAVGGRHDYNRGHASPEILIPGRAYAGRTPALPLGARRYLRPRSGYANADLEAGCGRIACRARRVVRRLATLRFHKNQTECTISAPAISRPATRIRKARSIATRPSLAPARRAHGDGGAVLLLTAWSPHHLLHHRRKGAGGRPGLPDARRKRALRPIPRSLALLDLAWREVEYVRACAVSSTCALESSARERMARPQAAPHFHVAKE